jgi:hypothetical protein
MIGKPGSQRARREIEMDDSKKPTTISDLMAADLGTPFAYLFYGEDQLPYVLPELRRVALNEMRKAGVKQRDLRRWFTASIIKWTRGRWIVVFDTPGASLSRELDLIEGFVFRGRLETHYMTPAPEGLEWLRAKVKNDQRLRILVKLLAILDLYESRPRWDSGQFLTLHLAIMRCWYFGALLPSLVSKKQYDAAIERAHSARLQPLVNKNVTSNKNSELVAKLAYALWQEGKPVMDGHGRPVLIDGQPKRVKFKSRREASMWPEIQRAVIQKAIDLDLIETGSQKYVYDMMLKGQRLH